MNTEKTFGEIIRTLRKQREEPLRIVAAAIGIDSSLLSKLETGERLPTHQQLCNFAAYFDIPFEEVAAQVIADKILTNYDYKPETLHALKIAEERIHRYLENTEQ